MSSLAICLPIKDFSLTHSFPFFFFLLSHSLQGILLQCGLRPQDSYPTLKLQMGLSPQITIRILTTLRTSALGFLPNSKTVLSLFLIGMSLPLTPFCLQHLLTQNRTNTKICNIGYVYACMHEFSYSVGLGLPLAAKSSQAKYNFNLSTLIGSVNSFPSKSDSLTAPFPITF